MFIGIVPAVFLSFLCCCSWWCVWTGLSGQEEAVPHMVRSRVLGLGRQESPPVASSSPSTPGGLEGQCGRQVR